MEIVNHECYVSQEVAKLLEQAGFDWKIYDGYITYEDGHGFTTKFQTPYNFNGDNEDLFASYRGHKEVLSRPTLEVAQRWLRDVKNISIEVKTCRWVNRHQDGKYTVSYRYELWPIDTSIIPNDDDKFIRYTIDYACNIEFQTYEKSQEAGIKKALEIILEKGE